MLIDHKVLAKIMEAASISKHEKICEVGTGHGILTAELCKHARYVVSYEVDRELFKKAQKEMQFQNLYLANVDLFNAKEQQQQHHFDVFISNLPYSRSRDAFEWLATQKFDRAIVMVQKEFGEKIMAIPGDEKYRAISAISTHCFRIDKLLVIGKQSFKPQHMVESVLIRLSSVKTITADTIKNLNLLFSSRNKKASAVAAKAGIRVDFGIKRIDQLEPNDLIKIAEAMK
jgi:16S rRNA (adenine1518-N6/adenine1519-N6)-dimethyltransferase